MLSDLSQNISRDYGVLTDAGFALRGTFLIGEDGILKHMSINDPDVGRNMDEYLRLVEAYNYVKEHGSVCPGNWKKAGDATMNPDMTAKSTQDYWKNFHKK
jgi:alkyl hydroperoxide reductase subunit AhpC